MDEDRQHVREAYRKMSFGEKIVYLFQNYWKSALLIGFFAALAIVFVGRLTWNRPADKVLGIGVHASILDTDLAGELKEDLTEQFPQFTEDGREFYTYWYYSGYAQDQSEQISTTATQLAGAVGAGQLDLMIGDLETLTEDAQMQYLCPLSELFTDEELTMIEEVASAESEDGGSCITRISFNITGDTGRTVSKVRDEAYLIRITGYNRTFDDLLITGDVYVGVVSGATCKEEARNFIFTLLGMDSYVTDQTAVSD